MPAASSITNREGSLGFISLAYNAAGAHALTAGA